MDIKAVIVKALKGEALSDEEKASVADFDLQKMIDGAQAEARRKAETALDAERKEREKLAVQIADLEGKLKSTEGAKLSATEQLQKALGDLQAKFEASEKRAADLDRAQKAAARSARVGEIAKHHGVAFVDGVDAKILTGAFEGALASVENLDDEAVVKPLVESFKASNKAIIRDLSGGGAGTPPRAGAGTAGAGATTATQREAELKKKGIL